MELTVHQQQQLEFIKQRIADTQAETARMLADMTSIQTRQDSFAQALVGIQAVQSELMDRMIISQTHFTTRMDELILDLKRFNGSSGRLPRKFESLPPELIQHVLSWVHPYDLQPLAGVSRRFWECIRSPKFISLNLRRFGNWEKGSLDRGFDDFDARFMFRTWPDVYSRAYTHGILAKVEQICWSDQTEIDSAPVRRELSPWFGSLSRLVELDLSNNNLQGSIPIEFENMTSLRRLILSNNAFAGDIPAQIFSLRTLEALDLSYNSFEGGIPTKLHQLTRLQNLFLHDNRLQGTIPPDLGKLACLLNLRLDNNQLTGAIPHEIGCLRSLQNLTLLNNELTGPLPDSLFTLAHLEYIDFSNNLLSGPLPPTISNLTRLESLILDANRFSGPIPNQLALLPLQNLYLGNNQFSGEIPEELGTMQMLQRLTLNNNELEGVFPPGIARLRMLFLHVDGNAGLVNVPENIEFVFAGEEDGVW
ncbi:hypothetical protein HDU98_005292 [Podochytrium sp. JEL0797]|nr:hypothetical protein HDU98_005292 [Podochytrium sp. JEL0797]